MKDVGDIDDSKIIKKGNRVEQDMILGIMHNAKHTHASFACKWGLEIAVNVQLKRMILNLQIFPSHPFLLKHIFQYIF